MGPIRASNTGAGAKQAAAPLPARKGVLIDAPIVVDRDQGVAVGEIFQGETAGWAPAGYRGKVGYPVLSGDAVNLDLV